jgi:hypothetical protein
VRVVDPQFGPDADHDGQDGVADRGDRGFPGQRQREGEGERPAGGHPLVLADDDPAQLLAPLVSVAPGVPADSLGLRHQCDQRLVDDDIVRAALDADRPADGLARVGHGGVQDRVYRWAALTEGGS